MNDDMFFFLGTVWVARGDSSTWAQNNPKYRPSAVSKSFENSSMELTLFII